MGSTARPYRVKRDLARSVGRPEALRRFGWIARGVWEAADRVFPVRIPRGWADLIQGEDDPLALQALPHPEELVAHGEDLDDPVGEKSLQPLPWLVQKHDDRALLLLTKRCHLYCRYCFRRSHERGPEDPTASELEDALAWVRSSGVRELILSGGDPLAVRDRKLFDVIDAVRPEVAVIRIHTRAPITAPDRVTDALVQGLRARAPVWVLVHANHPRELTPAVREGLARFVDAGLPVLNQAVLLRGVNDDVDTLARLSEDLVSLRVFPYYLHHTDHVTGNAHLRVTARNGLELHSALSRRVSGVALPRYVVDPPDGSGKIDVSTAVERGMLLD
jgi:lysine 2,3-aminomutase